MSKVVLEFEEYQQIRTALSRATGAMLAVAEAIEIGHPEKIHTDGVLENERLVTAATVTLQKAYGRALDAE